VQIFGFTDSVRSRLRTRTASAALLSALASAGAAQAADVSQETYDPSQIMLVTSVINATNPYMASWIEGAQAVADKLGLPLELVQSNGSSQQQMAGIQALAAQGKKIVLVTNPIAASDVPAMVNTLKRNGGYMVVWWNMPPGYEPSDVGDTLVAFGTYNGVTAGECGAENLIKAMGGKGNIIALQGVLDSTVSQERFAGLLETMKDYPDVKLLEMQPANWDQAVALQTTQQLLSKYGDQVNGVWTADDAMMLGAYEAVSKAGMLDKVHFSGEGAYPPTVDLMVKGGPDGPVAASSFHRGYIAAATGLAIAYKAATGELDIASLTPEQRHGQYQVGCVTPENAAEYQPNGGVPDGYVDNLLEDPFMDLVGGAVEVPAVTQ
jgi:ribose transport system substrate-binding protein